MGCNTLLSMLLIFALGWLLPAMPRESGAICHYDAAFQTGQHERFRSAEQDRSFYLYRPPDQNEPLPLVFALHGTGDAGESFAVSSGWLELAAETGAFVLLAPDSAGNGLVWPEWDGLEPEAPRTQPNPDLTFIDDLIACLDAHALIDSDRLYLAGFSAGGYFANYLAQYRPETFAAIAPASGWFGSTTPYDGAPYLPGTAAMVWWGGSNDGFSREGKWIAYGVQANWAAESYAARGRFALACDHGGGHRWPSEWTPQVWQFFDAHPYGKAPSPWAGDLPQSLTEICEIITSPNG